MSGADDLITAPARPGLTRTPRFRPTARCFVVNGGGRLLLFGGAISSTTAGGRTWFTPGGGVRLGESLPEAASRELAEETGLRIPASALSPVIALDAGIWWAGEQPFFGVDSFFLVRVGTLTVTGTGREEAERSALQEHRWWTAAELDETRDRVFPLCASGLLGRVLAAELPAAPLHLTWRPHRTSPR